MSDWVTRWTAMGIGVLAVLAAAAQEAQAHPRRLPAPDLLVTPDDDLWPHAEYGGVSPSYEIGVGRETGAPVVRVIGRCQYPDGWNVTDFSRDLNGIPNGRDHACPVDVPRVRARSR